MIHSETSRTLLTQFLDKWPLERLKQMTLAEYAMGDKATYQESFSHWIENVTDELGKVSGIGGGGAFKHGIYIQSNPKNFNNKKRYKSDGKYAWLQKYGNTPEEAFERIKEIIVKVAELASQGTFDQIEHLDFYAPVKWKVAFLYSKEKLLLIYKKEALEVIAQSLGLANSNQKATHELHQFILEQKSSEEDFYEYAQRIWQIYEDHKEHRYYLVGSYWNGHEQLDRFLADGIWENGHNEGNLDKVKGVKPGDLLALKASFYHSVQKTGIIRIKGLGKVIGNQGDGKMIQVDWQEDFEGYDVPLNSPYRHTIDEVIDQEHIQKIFYPKKENLNMQTHSLEKQNIPLNQILYGPPGTGKTYTLTQTYKKQFTEEAAGLSKDEFLLQQVKSLKWWEVLGITLINLGQASVSQIQDYPLVQAKLSISASKRPQHTLWGRLQTYTSSTCERVNLSQYSEPRIFYKNEDSTWQVVSEEVDAACPELHSLASEIQGFQSQTVRKEHFTFITFHQNYAYEDFLEGIKPYLDTQEEQEFIERARFRIERGIFYQSCLSALELAGYTSFQACYEDTPQNRRRKFGEDIPHFAIFIDEINRGNISAIFGELITLIEPDKRIGAEQEIWVHLPYSKEAFSVPPNLHLIGTMNTADRSVEALDTALRRRFSFREISPRPDLLKDILLDDLSLAKLLSTTNQRLEKLLDKDHQIGHSYFLSLEQIEDSTERWQALRSIFQNQVLPLLQEYFYGNLGKIGLVLGGDFVEVQTDDIQFAPDFQLEGYEDFAERPVYRINTFENNLEKFQEAIRKLCQAPN